MARGADVQEFVEFLFGVLRAFRVVGILRVLGFV